MTRYCKDCYINYYYNLKKNYNNCGFFKSRKPKKLCLNLSSKFVVFMSIMKKFPNVLVHTLQAIKDYRWINVTYVMVSYYIIQRNIIIDFE